MNNMVAQAFSTNYISFDYLFGKILDFFRFLGEIFSGDWFGLKLFLTIVIILLLAVIFYTLLGIHDLNKKEEHDLKKTIKTDPEPMIKNPRWEVVQNHINSNNPSDWRLAIIEADLILDDMVARMGYKGENLGDRLKNVERSDFLTLQNAWDAHKVRNQIAHQGSDFKLERKDAENTIAEYETVFREFKFI